MTLAIPQPRLDGRRALLGSLDRMRRQADRSGLMEGLDHFEQQAFNLVLSALDSRRPFATVSRMSAARLAQ
jgi:hypothetical protein